MTLQQPPALLPPGHCGLRRSPRPCTSRASEADSPLGQLCSGARLPRDCPGWPWRQCWQSASTLGDISGSLAPCPANSWCWLLWVLAQGKPPKCKVEKVTRSELSAPQTLQALSSIWWVSLGFFKYYSLQMLKGGCLQHLVCLLLLCMILAQLVQ